MRSLQVGYKIPFLIYSNPETAGVSRVAPLATLCRLGLNSPEDLAGK
jgi:hypothetical protein